MNNKRLTPSEKTSAYNTFSRRGLIKICNDYDKENGNKLLDYVHNKIADDVIYESERIPEKIVDIGDGLIEVLEFAKETQTISKVSSLVNEVSDMVRSKRKVEAE